MMADSKLEEQPQTATTVEKEEPFVSGVETNSGDEASAVTSQSILVYLAINLVFFTQIFNLVGTGAFASKIALSIGGASKSVWLSQAPVICTCILGPPVAQAADLWGRKWFITILTGFGVVGSVILSRASSMEMAIAGETVASVCYGSQPLLYAVASEIFPRRYRPAAQAGLNITPPIAATVALLGGSAIFEKHADGFRIYWYIAIAIQVFTTIVLVALYHPPARSLQQSLTLSQKLRKLDWTACSLFAPGLLCFIMSMSWAQNPYPWRSAHVLAPLFVGVTLLTALAVHQTYIKKDGLIHHGLFQKDRNFAIALFCFLVDGMSFFALNVYYPFEVSVLYNMSTQGVGIRYCIAYWTGIVGCVGVAVYSSLTRDVRSPIIVAFLIFIIFNVLMVTTPFDSQVHIFVGPALYGIGFVLTLTNLITVAQLSAPPHLIAISSGLVIGMRSLGSSVALAIYTAIFSSSISMYLAPKIASAVLPLGLPSTSLLPLINALAANDQAAVAQVPGTNPEIIEAAVHGLKVAYRDSFRGIWIFAASFSAAALVASCFLVNPKQELNDHIDAPLEQKNK